MNSIRHRFLLIFLLTLCTLANGQVQTPRYGVSINSNTTGFYEYLPQGYETGDKYYPLIISLHGKGDLGAGDAATLPRVLSYGLPRLINEGKFPTSFAVGDSVHRFIVISPQFHSWPAPPDVEAVLDYVLGHYRVNWNRVYLTGLSMGGGAVWDFAGQHTINATRIAAIVPICGSSYPEEWKGRVMATAALPVWATHNSGDNLVAVSKTHGYVSYINAAPAPTPLARKTIFEVEGHDAWLKTCDPLFKEDGKNIYEWMLGYSRNTLTASSNSPVCAESTLELSAWSLDGATYSWTGPGGFTSNLRTPVISPVTTAVGGTYTVTMTKGALTQTAQTTVVVTTPKVYYRDGDQDGWGGNLSITACRPPRGYLPRGGDCTDNNSKINPEAIEVCDGLDNDCDGQIDEGLAITRFYLDSDGDGRGNASFYKDSCAQPSGYVGDGSDCADNNATIYPGAAELIDGLDNNCNGLVDDGAVPGIRVNVFGGTDPQAPGWNNWNVASSLTPSSFSYASGTESSISAVLTSSSGVADNGATYGSGMAPRGVLRHASTGSKSRTLTIRGLAPGKKYSIELYASRGSNPGYETVFSVGSSTRTVATYRNFTTKAVFTELTPTSAGQIVVAISSAQPYNYLNGFILTEAVAGTNQPPTANAGGDKSITLPASSITLDGSAQDPDGTISTYAWTKVFGPAAAIGTPSSPSTSVSNLVEGTYVFRLTVTDDDGATAFDEVQVVVSPGGALTRYIKLNLFGGTAPYANPEWNNWNVVSSLSSGALKYADASLSSVSAILSQSNGVQDNGASYGGTMCPPEVLRYTTSSGVTRTLTLTGLNPSKSYSVELYASRGTSGNSTVFTAGGTSITIATSNNKSAKALFTNLTPTSSGTLVITLSKVNAYNYLNGLVLTESTPPPPPPGPRSLKVNLVGGTNPYNNAEWNNWNVSSSLNSGALKYSDAASSSISAALGKSSGINDNGTAYGSGMAPAEVLRYASNATTARTLIFSGLSTSKVYNLELYASRGNYSGNFTNFTIGGAVQSISTFNNLESKALFTGLVPSAAGQIEVSIQNAQTYNYLNGFTLTEGTASAPVTSAGKATDGREERTTVQHTAPETIPSTTGFRLSVYPNPSTGIITVFSNSTKELLLTVRDVAGRAVAQRAIPAGATPQRFHLAPGIYLAEGLSSGERSTLKFIVLSR